MTIGAQPGIALPSLDPPYAALLWLLTIAFQVLQFSAPVCLMAWRQPHRSHFVLRCTGALVILTLAMSLVSALDWSIRLASPAGSMAPYVANFLTYSLLLCLMVPMTLLCLDAGRWNAILYATAGYTIQNLGTGVGELLRIVWEDLSRSSWDLLSNACISDAVALAVLLACYRPFVKRIRDGGVLRNDSHGMLGMAGAVIAVVIANDVVIRGLDNRWETRGIPLPFLVTFRVTHLVVCLFVLYAECENLFNVRLRAEVGAQRDIAAERERQYELSRQNVAAVNARMHDVRHTVLSELKDAAPGVGRETLVEVARSISVYDSIIHTGNEALDTILSEKQLQFSREGVTLACVADGRALGFMPASEVYALFGNLLNLALREAVLVDESDQRTVSLNIHRVGSLASVHVSGTRGKPSSRRDVKGEATQLAREIVAARAIVERHGGTLVTSSDGANPAPAPNGFSVDAIIPQA